MSDDLRAVVAGARRIGWEMALLRADMAVFGAVLGRAEANASTLLDELRAMNSELGGLGAAPGGM